MENECEKMKELISCAIDGEISEAEMNKVEQHSLICLNCSELLIDYQAICNCLETLKAEPPSNLHSILTNAIDKEREQHPISEAVPKFSPSNHLIAAAMLFILTFFCIIKSLQSTELTSPNFLTRSEVPSVFFKNMESSAQDLQLQSSSEIAIMADFAEAEPISIEHIISEQGWNQKFSFVIIMHFEHEDELVHTLNLEVLENCSKEASSLSDISFIFIENKAKIFEQLLKELPSAGGSCEILLDEDADWFDKKSSIGLIVLCSP